MAGLFSTGPVSIWVGPSTPTYGLTTGGSVNLSAGNSGSPRPQFLGHGEYAPEIDVIPSYYPWLSDAGGEVPTEMLYDGQKGLVRVDLNRFVWGVLRQIQARANGRNFSTIDPGLDDAGQIGTPMLLNGCAYKLYLRFERSGHPTMSSPTNGPMPAGYRFFKAMLDPESLKAGSASETKISLIWQCFRESNPKRKTTFGRGSHRLYDEDMSDLIGLPQS